MDNADTFLAPKMGRVKRIHLVGIGGAGMCGIAEVLHFEGYQVTGSDLAENKVVQRLRSLGIDIKIGHQAENILNADVLVRSSAIDTSNPEIVAAMKQQIPIIPRALMLAELMRFRHGIAIAGTHGKTTTTSIVSSLLAEGGLNPSFVIGGKLNSCGTNAHLGHSPYFVVEADESDASFLYLKPMMAIVTNIDADHMGTYDDDFNKLRATFVQFLHQLPFYGLAVLCFDDPEVRGIIPEIQRPILTYGFNESAQYRAVNWVQQELRSSFTVRRPKPYSTLQVQFNWPGAHNVLNALAAIAIATELNVSDDAIIAGLSKFQGVGRRFQMLGERQFANGKAMIIDDYGHHPREIKATIDAFRAAWPEKRLVHVFQPHRYSRTQSLLNEFAEVLSMADELLLFDVYAAGEKAIPGVNSESIVKKMGSHSAKVVLISEQTLEAQLDKVIQEGDVILMQGAGNIGQLAINLAQQPRETV